MAGITTRCKFRCESVTPSFNTVADPKVLESEHIVLRAAYSDNPENKVWSKYTPSGMFEMSVTNPAVCGQFTVGKEYFLDITEAV